MKIEYTLEARNDLEDTFERIVVDNPLAAARLEERLLSLIERLAAREFEGPEIELTTGERVRSWPVPPLRVYYRREPERLLVLRVYHQARQPITK